MEHMYRQSHGRKNTRPTKKSVFQVTSLKILGRIGSDTYFFNNFFLQKKIYNFMHFKMQKIIYFPENLKKILGFTTRVRVTLNTGTFYFGPIKITQPAHSSSGR